MVLVLAARPAAWSEDETTTRPHGRFHLHDIGKIADVRIPSCARPGR